MSLVRSASFLIVKNLKKKRKINEFFLDTTVFYD